MCMFAWLSLYNMYDIDCVYVDITVQVYVLSAG